MNQWSEWCEENGRDLLLVRLLDLVLGGD